MREEILLFWVTQSVVLHYSSYRTLTDPRNGCCICKQHSLCRGLQPQITTGKPSAQVRLPSTRLRNSLDIFMVQKSRTHHAQKQHHMELALGNLRGRAHVISFSLDLCWALGWAPPGEVCEIHLLITDFYYNSTASGIELFGASVRCWKYRAREGGSKRKQRPVSVGIPKAHCLLVQKYICKQLYLHVFPYAIFCSIEISLTCHQIYLFSVYKPMIPHKFTRFYNIMTI